MLVDLELEELDYIRRNLPLKERKTYAADKHTHASIIKKMNEKLVYCAAKSDLNNPGFPACNCHNFCKYDGIQFDTSLA